MPEHTAGPWKPARAHEDYNGPLWDLDEEDRASYEARPFTGIASPSGTVFNAHDLFEFRNPADAHLIAAAPELLAALEETLSRLQGLIDIADDGEGRRYDEAAANRARAAIAKARGEG